MHGSARPPGSVDVGRTGGRYIVGAEAFARAHASWRKGQPTALSGCLGAAGYLERRGGPGRKRRPIVAGDPAILGREHGMARDDHDRTLLRIALVRTLIALPRRPREVVALHFLEGMSEAEVAACLSISVGTVKKTSSRARDALRRDLGEDWDRVVLTTSGT